MHIFTYTPDPENKFDHVKVTVQTESPLLSEIIQAFESYLKAAGFSFEGNLDIIEDHIVPAEEE